MTRLDPDSKAGWVNWPTPGPEWTDRAEGGMFVLAVWADPDNAAMVCMPEYTLCLATETVSDISGPDAEMLREEWTARYAPLGAVLPIGSTGGTWQRTDSTGRYFAATPDDITPDGRAVLHSLTALYGYPPTLVTLIDT